MALFFVRNDITKMKVDAIVNAANNSLLGGGGVDGAIHSAAGPELLDECKKLGGCATGEAKATDAYRLPCKFIIHTVGPIWQGNEKTAEKLLVSCYKRSLELAENLHCNSIAFPLISSGAYGCPKETAFRIAVDVISAFLQESDLTVYIVLFDSRSISVSEKALRMRVEQLIDDSYAEKALSSENRRIERIRGKAQTTEDADILCFEKMAFLAPASIGEKLQDLDESFQQALLRLIDEKGMSDSECYKKANIDRKLFSKIRCAEDYKPKKETAVAFALALELSLDDTNALLEKAGFILSGSREFDVIVKYCIENRYYDILTVNKLLYDFDQPLLGASAI